MCADIKYAITNLQLPKMLVLTDLYYIVKRGRDLLFSNDNNAKMRYTLVMFIFVAMTMIKHRY